MRTHPEWKCAAVDCNGTEDDPCGADTRPAKDFAEAITPWPWVVGCSTERNAKPGLVHVLSYGKDGPYKTVAVAETEEDAVLLAAAPELLDFVRSIAEYDEYRNDDEPLSDIVSRIEERARRLLVKLQVRT